MRIALCFILTLIVAACQSNDRSGSSGLAAPFFEAPNIPAGDSHVILITIDGFAAYYLDDPNAHIPTIRTLASRGVTSAGARVVNPSVTWPNHTTLLTGVRADKHSCYFNGVLERDAPGKPVKVNGAQDQSALVAVPTLFDMVHAKGMPTAAINWPCTRGAKSVDDNFPDVPDQIAHMTPRLREMLIADGMIPDATTKSFRDMSMIRRDQAWAAAVMESLRKRKPAFLSWHILNTDSIQHKYGPKSDAAYTALAVADAHIRQLLEVLEEQNMLEKTTIFLTADHGFAQARKLIMPNVVFAKNDLLTPGATAPVAAKAQIIPEGGTAMLYLTDPATYDADKARVISLMKQTEGIADVVEPSRYAELGYADPRTNKQAPDLVLVAQDGYAFLPNSTGDDVVIEPVMGRHNVGHHGYIAAEPKMRALFIAAGRGIARGKKIGEFDNINIAPTMARLLGVELPQAQGKVMTEIFE